MITTKQLIKEIKELKADFDAAFDLLLQRVKELEENADN